MVSRILVEQPSPRSGRQLVAHGASRGSEHRTRTLTPVPSPARRERGAEGGVRAIQPRAHALGYSISPLAGLRETRADEKDLFSELLTQDTSRSRPHGHTGGVGL